MRGGTHAEDTGHGTGRIHAVEHRGYAPMENTTAAGPRHSQCLHGRPRLSRNHGVREGTHDEDTGHGIGRTHAVENRVYASMETTFDEPSTIFRLITGVLFMIECTASVEWSEPSELVLE